MTVKYLASLIAGAVISLGLLTTSKDLLTPAEAQSTPENVFSVFHQPQAPLVAEVYDDGQQLTGGAHLATTPSVRPTSPTVTVVRTVYVRRTSGWWTRGPIRRVVSWPIRRLIARRCCR